MSELLLWVLRLFVSSIAIGLLVLIFHVVKYWVGELENCRIKTQLNKLRTLAAIKKEQEDN